MVLKTITLAVGLASVILVNCFFFLPKIYKSFWPVRLQLIQNMSVYTNPFPLYSKPIAMATFTTLPVEILHLIVFSDPVSAGTVPRSVFC